MDQTLPSRAELERDIHAALDTLQMLRGPALGDEERRWRAWLKEWQSQRLARTHAALLQSERHGPAARFFLEDLYGPKDHQRRDHDIARVLPKLLKLLPAAALHALAQALHMDVLSETLDAELAQALRQAGALQHAGDIDEARYATAYRACGRTVQRQEQLELVASIGRSLDQLTRLPMLAATLRMMKRPAELAGLGELQNFLQRGFTAFAHMKGADEFLDSIIQGERRLMQHWLQA